MASAAEIRPTLVYDGNCAFCGKWVDRWKARTGSRVDYVPFQRPGTLQTHDISKAQAEAAVQLVEPQAGASPRKTHGAEAVFRALSYAPEFKFLRRMVALSPIKAIAQAAYRVVARHRKIAAWVDWFLVGTSTEAPRYRFTRAIYFRGLGVTFWIAFRSLQSQALGLYGKRGVLPIADYLERLSALPFAKDRVRRLRTVPTVFWWNASDRAILNVCRAGQLCAFLLTMGIAPRAMCAVLWALYLSFVSVGRDFLSFQWDVLLLEAALFSAVAAPPGLRSRIARDEDPPWLALQLLRFLFFRLYFESGLCKILSHDPNWRSGEACAYHYETQPLPTPFGWMAHQLPRRFQRLSSRIAVGIELIIPWLVYAPRRVRRSATGVLLVFQGLIAATGNYGFFNLLTSLLGLWGLDDEFVSRLFPARLRRKRLVETPTTSPMMKQPGATLASLPLLLISMAQLLSRFPRTESRLKPLERLDGVREQLAELRSLNPYGLFSVMTTLRPEIIVEGSDDGHDWKAYEFRYKPGAPDSRPRWVAPHQPRLDWQMWFAAMQQPPGWFLSFVTRLLQGAPEVLTLLKTNPFPENPPRYVRASYYEYKMASREERMRSGHWWHRSRLGLYLPICQLQPEGSTAA